MPTQTASKKLVVLVLILSAVLTGCDLGTKQLAQNELRARGPKPLVAGLLDLRYTENRDVAFNTLRWIPERVRRPLVLGLNLIVMSAIIFLLVRDKARSPVEQLGLVLVLGGAIGNFADRGLRGYVIDFIHLHGWPIFNLADIYLCVGAGLLLVESLRRRRARAEGAPR
jgi:signal peptidase II